MNFISFFHAKVPGCHSQARNTTNKFGEYVLYNDTITSVLLAPWNGPSAILLTFKISFNFFSIISY
jgi:hypothetical protein